ncbi:UNVERIFIED_CONTAM: hypothetical protein Sindi_0720300 [Sesamum indicum]
MDYGSSGNRVWIPWDNNLVDVDVVECDRRELWGALETIATQCVGISWLVGGDFNAVRDLSEVCGTSGDIRIAMDDFNACIENAGLLPLPMQGEWYTLHNYSATPRNLWKRLDRMMINDRWMARFLTAFYSTLTPRTSDHSQMVLYGDRQQRFGDMFRFDNYLTRLPEFIASVQKIWHHNIIGIPMSAVRQKLKALKPIFRQQRRNKGDLSHNVQLAKGFLEATQILVSSNRRDELYIQLEHYFRLVLTKAAKMEQTMLQKRAKMQWMKGGDQCSRVFFYKIAQRRSTRRILQINDDHGVTHSEPREVINRSTLTVDIQKAYNTMEWDFMIAVMELFGFPSTFVKWIEGGPLSPYLFVLVMEVLHMGLLQQIDQDELFSFHWKCDTARVFQLGFADDVLLFYDADMDLIGVFKTGLDHFAE